MGKLSILVFLLFLAALGLVSMENQEMITVKVPFGSLYTVPKVVLILLSTIAGALVVLMISFIRDTKRIIDNLQSQKRQKREARIDAYYSKALNSLLGNKQEDAKEALTEVLKEEPEHVDALLRLGDIALDKNEYAVALDYYKKARDIGPTNLRALLSMAKVMERMMRDGDALRYLDDILDIDAENLTALYRRRVLLEKKEKWDDLLSLQKSVIKLVGNDKDKAQEECLLLGYKYEYARSSLESGHLEKAEKAFRTLLKMDCSFLPAYLGITEVMISKGETEETINFLEKSYEQLNSMILLARLEDLLISVGEPGRLIRFYRNAIARTPEDNRLKFLLGKLYYRLEMVDDAIDTLSSIDTGSFAPHEFYSLRGELYMKRNQVSRALEEFRRACGIRQASLLPYCCSQCGYRSPDWSGRCTECSEWNTFRLDLYGTCKA
ncbi:MAG: tetratricopeptide repeat protein [Thermodesulfovibrionales bacterium]